MSGDETGVAAHQLDQADAVAGTLGFGMGAGDDLAGLLDCGLEAEALENQRDVVVNRLGNADDGNLQITPPDFPADVTGAPQGAVAPHTEKYVDAQLNQRVRH